jgi:hypothetical protein
MFLTCSDPARLQTLADALTPRDLDRGGQKWLLALVPCFTPTERRVCAHRLFFAQVEYSDTAGFHRRAALDALGERLFDANRPIGQPTKLGMIYGRRVTKRDRGKLETVIEDLDLPNPVIRSSDRDGSVNWSRKSSTPPLSLAPAGLPNLRPLPEALRARLRAADRRFASAVCRRCRASRDEARSTGRTLSTHCHRPRRALARGRLEGRCMTHNSKLKTQNS